MEIVPRVESKKAMSETEGTAVSPAAFMEYLKSLPFCKQGEDVLVAVGKATAEVIEQMRDREVKMFPGGMTIRMQKSTMTSFQRKQEEDEPLPVVIVWKSTGVEIWYRKNNPTEYPYDGWTGGAAGAYEQERVIMPAETLGEGFAQAHSELAAKAAACPSIMPNY